MVIKLGINGFGRIGRVIFRAGLKRGDLQISAINDPAINVEYICYLIKFDSTHGKFCGSVTHTKDEILINGCRIKVFHEKLPSNVPWQTADVQYVIEASGMFTSLEKASGHLASDGVKRVIVTAPSVDVPMIILGVNQDKLNAGQKVISCASSTLYCLAPIVKILEDSFGVAEGFITSIHAMTPSLKPLDGLCLRGKHWRDYRSIHQNIIPATTGACKALGRIIPRVKDKLTGLAFRVPIVNVSVLDLTIRLNSNTSIQDIIKSVERAGNENMKGIIGISNEEAVSSDFIGESRSCILDADSSLQLKPNFYKLVCWYENEYSYACRVIDSVVHSERQIKTPFITVNIGSSSSRKHDMVQQTDSCKKDMICSASEYTTLKTKQLLTRPLLRKPVSNTGTQSLNNNKETKKIRTEIFRDEVKGGPKATRQDRSAFFHSCVAITPQNREEIECIKAQERLEMLKKEFSKMVNITESLLKKSYISNVQLTLDNKAAIKKRISKCIDTLPEIEAQNNIQDSCGTFTEVYDDVNNSSVLFDVAGDHRSNIRTRSADFSNKSGKHLSPQESMFPFKISLPKRINYESRNKLIIFENVPTNKSTKDANRILPDKILKIKLNDKDNGKDTQIDNSAEVKDLTQNFQVQYCVLENNRSVKEKTNATHSIEETPQKQDKETQKRPSRTRASDSGFFSLIKNNSLADIVKNKKRMIRQSTKQHTDNDVGEFKSSKSNILHSENVNNEQVIEKDIAILNDVKNNTLSISPPTEEDTDTLNDEVQNLMINTDQSEDTVVTNKSSEEANSPSSPDPVSAISTMSDHTSKCGSPDNTSLTVSNAEFTKHKQDIYDKLDSISGTDSNNSFQIYERKSQIINISDLTNSLEDLARLDKICKIIEISDELSNKLFSALDNEDIDIRKKRWSFKDLCEKIKLDDFCDKIFGKTSD